MSTATAEVAWRRDTFADTRDFALGLDAEDRRSITSALRELKRARGLEAPQHLGSTDFAFCAQLERKLEDASQRVRDGHGFVLLRGLPADELDLQQFTAAVWGIGTRFGQALSQNAQGELITAVVDATREEATPRMYRSNLELRPHSDITAMIALACWNVAQSGGRSVLVSARTVHDEIARRAPHLLERLYRGYHYHRLGEEGPGEEPTTPYRVPVFTMRGGQLSCRYQRSGIAGGHRARNVPLEAADLEAFDLFDSIAKAPANRLDFDLERGDMLIINNYTVMHARTTFTNFPEPERRRHLVRLWLDVPGFREVPKEINLFGDKNGVPPQPGRRASFDFGKLYRDDPAATGGIPDVLGASTTGGERR